MTDPDILGASCAFFPLPQHLLGPCGQPGGLALKRGRPTWRAPNLLDEETGITMSPTLHLPGRELALVTLAYRQQGRWSRQATQEIVGIMIFASDVAFINRQRGSGTRILDYYLRQEGLIPGN